MMVFDYLICNRDRHGVNIELIQNEDGTIQLAPLFDHGVSLLFSCYDNEEMASEYDVMKDRMCNNYFFTRSLEENLNYIPKDIKLNSISQDDYGYIMRGIDENLPSVYGKKIWEMITRRWQRYEEIQNCK